MENHRLKVRLQRAHWYNGADVLIQSASGRSFVQNLVLTEYEPGALKGPSFRINDDTAQVLMDDLWQAGYRPTEGSGSAGSLRATEKHLEDMRALVAFKIGAKFK